MAEEARDLVTTITAKPDLTGLHTFQKEIDRATKKVKELDAVIRRTNQLSPHSRNGRGGSGGGPRPPLGAGVTAAGGLAIGAAGMAGGFGSHLVSRAMTPPPSSQKGLSVWGGSGGRGADFGRFDFGSIDWGGGPEPKAIKTPKAAKKPGESSNGMMRGLAGAAIVYGLAAAVGAVADQLDRIQSAKAQLDYLPQSIEGGAKAFQDMSKAANDVRVSSEPFISTYTNIATATKDLKMSQEDTIKTTQGLIGALQLGGGSQQAVDNALYQMGQAFSSDRFAGDEFRSFMEAIGTQAPEVAKAFDTDVKGLRKMSEEGKLTASVVSKAFMKMSDNVLDKLNKQGWKWGQVTAIMKNDWLAFVAEATEGGEWAKLMGWINNNITPAFKSAEKSVAKFWSTTTDESKASILIGILGTIGAAFAALAIPVLAATWPFLAVGAAIFLLYEIFQEFKHWIDGSGLTIFDSLFGSFDEFEKRYPNIVKGFRAIADSMTDVWEKGEKVGKVINATVPEDQLNERSRQTMKDAKDNLNPLVFVEKVLGLFMDGNESDPKSPSAGLSGNQTKNTQITNNFNPTIHVESEAKGTSLLGGLYSSFVGANSLPNMAETSGAE
ncbi:tape measure protein [Yersinia massiliensis]|uniref:tape measure protein n=1 Tax=Yersinia massiliensis TaxID=419257 RepID=UPI001CFDBD04|nr:tape measure protein [Yersinia massiliensis]MCB5308352.1 tape measure protein [Yersinia massiliensis]